MLARLGDAFGAAHAVRAELLAVDAHGFAVAFIGAFFAFAAVLAYVCRAVLAAGALRVAAQLRAVVAFAVAFGADRIGAANAQTAALTPDVIGALVAFFAVRTEPFGTVFASSTGLVIGSAEPCAAGAGAAVTVGADPVVAVEAGLAVFAVQIRAFVAAVAFRADIVRAGGAAVSAFVDDIGAVLAATAFLAELEAVRAFSAAGTACRTHAVGAEMAAGTDLIPAVEAVLAAVLADRCAILAAVAAARAGDGAGVAAQAVLTVVADTVSAPAAIGAELIPAVAAVLAADPTDIGTAFTAVAAEAGICASAALGAVGAPAVALHARLAFHAVFAENIAVCAVALAFFADDETVAASAVASLTDQVGAVAAGVAALAPVVCALGADLAALGTDGSVASAASGAAILTAAAAKRKIGVEFAIVALCADFAAVFADDFSAALAAVAAFAAVAGRLHTERAKLTVRTGFSCFTGGAGCPAKRADPFHAVGAMLRAAFADSGTVAAQITVGAPVVARTVRADTSAVVAKAICSHALVAGTAVVILIAASAALGRAVVAALAAVADVVVRYERTAELTGTLLFPCIDRKYESANGMIVVVIMVMEVVQYRQRDKSEHQLKT